MTDSEEEFEKFPVSWEEMHRHCRALARRLKTLGPWKGIIAVTRGGLVPAAIMARELDIRLIDTICIVSYQHQKQGELKVLKGVDGDGDGWLVVEDVIDTGVTMRHIRKMLPKAHVTSVYVKPAGRDLADSHGTEVSQDTWIFFPWDLALTYAKPLAGSG